MAHRVEFFKYDTHGGKPPNKNPIYIAKNRYGQTGSLLIDSYFDLEGGWVGGVYLTWDYWNSKSGLRPLLEWFGSKNVARWVSAFQYIFE